MAAALNATKRSIGARAVVVNRARDQLLAGAGLAVNQHGAVHRRHELERREERLHRAVPADDVVEPEPVVELRPELGVLLAQPLLLDAGPEHTGELGQLERLDQEVDGAALDRADRFGHAAEPRDHHGEDFRVARERRVEDVHAVGIRQPQVDDEAVVGEGVEALDGFRGIGRLRDRETVGFQGFDDELTEIRFVFDDEHRPFGLRHEVDSRTAMVSRFRRLT